jgi:8-oxo-dGTP diphosphatase
MERFRLRGSALIIHDGSILLIEYRNDHDDGVHYNLPGGGVEPGETLIEAVMREAKEEACIDVEVGPVAFVYEYQPKKNSNIYGDVHSIHIAFECKLTDGSLPKLPDSPDPNQTAVKWIPIVALNTIQLYPEIGNEIQHYYAGKGYRNYIEEHEIQCDKQRNSHSDVYIVDT